MNKGGINIYNILTEPWIPVETMNGGYAKTGILDLFRNAHLYRRLAYADALSESAVLTLLLVFAMDAFKKMDDEDEAETIDTPEMYDRGKFSESELVRLNDYVKECEADGVSFDLFDPEHPFMQAWGVDTDLTPQPTPKVGYNMPSGESVLFETRVLAKDATLSPEEYMTNLCVMSRHSLRGGESWNVNICGETPAFFFAEGKNLFETLTLNMLREAPEINGGGKVYGTPFYRKMHSFTPKKPLPRRSDCHILEMLTYPVRRFRAILNEDDLVASVLMGHGPATKWPDGTFVADGYFDPYKAYSITPKKDGAPVISALTGNNGVFWQNVATLLTGGEKESSKVKQAESLKNAHNILKGDGIKSVNVVLYAAESQQTHYQIAERFSFTLPGSTFDSDDIATQQMRDAVYSMVQYVDDKSKLLSSAVATVATLAVRKEEKECKDAFSKVMKTKAPIILKQRVQTVFFPLIEKLADTGTVSMEEWEAAVDKLANRVYKEITDPLIVTMSAEKRIKAAESRFILKRRKTNKK